MATKRPAKPQTPTCLLTKDRVTLSFAPTRKRSTLDAAVSLLVATALEEAGGNKSAAARLLGVDRKALERRVAKFARGKRR